jgi:hypothetical protein
LPSTSAPSPVPCLHPAQSCPRSRNRPASSFAPTPPTRRPDRRPPPPNPPPPCCICLTERPPLSLPVHTAPRLPSPNRPPHRHIEMTGAGSTGECQRGRWMRDAATIGDPVNVRSRPRTRSPPRGVRVLPCAASNPRLPLKKKVPPTPSCTCRRARPPFRLLRSSLSHHALMRTSSLLPTMPRHCPCSPPIRHRTLSVVDLLPAPSPPPPTSAPTGMTMD